MQQSLQHVPAGTMTECDNAWPQQVLVLGHSLCTPLGSQQSCRAQAMWICLLSRLGFAAGKQAGLAGKDQTHAHKPCALKAHELQQAATTVVSSA